MIYTVKKKPAKWISAHRTNEYTLRLSSHNVLGTYDASGYFAFITSTAMESPFVGQRIFIGETSGSNGLYNGYHIIREVISTAQVVTETAYAGVLTGVNYISQIILPTVSVYKGYAVGEIVLTYDSGTIDLSDIQPYELVAQFQPETNLDGEIVFDFSGYTKAIIESPYKGEYNIDEKNYIYSTGVLDYIPLNYARVKLVISGEIGQHYCANSSITTEELNTNFVDTKRQLQPLFQPVKYFGQYSLGDYIDSLLQTRKTK